MAAVSLLAAAVAQHQQAGAGRAPPPVIAAVVATLSAHSAQALLDVLLELCRQQPQAAAHLLLHSLDPAGWELLSGCFEQLQEELAEAGGMGGLYGVGWSSRRACIASVQAVGGTTPGLTCVEAAKAALAWHPTHACRQCDGGGGGGWSSV